MRTQKKRLANPKDVYDEVRELKLWETVSKRNEHVLERREYGVSKSRDDLIGLRKTLGWTPKCPHVPCTTPGTACRIPHCADKLIQIVLFANGNRALAEAPHIIGTSSSAVTHDFNSGSNNGNHQRDRQHQSRTSIARTTGFGWSRIGEKAAF